MVGWGGVSNGRFATGKDKTFLLRLRLSSYADHNAVGMNVVVFQVREVAQGIQATTSIDIYNCGRLTVHGDGSHHEEEKGDDGSLVGACRPEHKGSYSEEKGHCDDSGEEGEQGLRGYNGRHTLEVGGHVSLLVP